MTMREKMIALLEQNGMFTNQAESVMKIAESAEELTGMERRWNDDVCEYPAPLLAVTWMSVRSIAREWIEKECPKAWFLPMFKD